MNSFEKEKMQIQYSALVFIVLYFHDYELTLEIYESDHCNRDIGFEIGRQKAIEERLGCEFIKINPDKENSYIIKAINEIFGHIKQLPKETLVNKILFKKLLGIEFKSDNDIKSKTINFIANKILPCYVVVDI